jgi:hypothetical protein
MKQVEGKTGPEVRLSQYNSGIVRCSVVVKLKPQDFQVRPSSRP